MKELSQIHSMRHHYSDAKINDTTKKKNKKKERKKRKLQANITDEHRHKNPQQNTGKQNPTMH